MTFFGSHLLYSIPRMIIDLIDYATVEGQKAFDVDHAGNLLALDRTRSKSNQKILQPFRIAIKKNDFLVT